MAEAIQVSAAGGIPPIPASATPSNPASNTPPTPDQLAPGFVNPNPAPGQGGMTPEQVQAAVAAALAAQAAKEPQVAPTGPQVQLPSTTDAGEIADPVLRSMTSALVSMSPGLDLDRAIGNALAYGRPELVDVAYIREKGGAQADSIINVAKAAVERANVQANEVSNAVYQTAGGAENWNTATAVFNQKAPQHLRMVVAQMIDSGNHEAIKSAAQTVMEYVNQNGLVANPAQLINAGATGGSAAQALSKAEFQEALFKLDPNSRGYNEARQSLFARRQIGKQLGK